MIHIYKDGGERKTESGIEFTIKAINSNDLALFLKDGWVKSKGELKPEEKAEEKPEETKKKKAKGD